ncbi:MAG: hypothetical protein JJ913_18130 [Rhizobiaceae bacterium]|nr:hypothetical protein [Rhizobiaceae bacterium]
MSLTLLVVMVVVGVAAIVVAVHLTGGSNNATLSDAQAAKARFASDFADIGVETVWLTEDGTAAFLALEDSRVGIVAGFGDRFLTRILTAAEAGGVPVVDGRTVTLRMNDFTWRGGTFVFADEDQARAVAGLFGAPAQIAEGAEAHG